MHCYLYDTSARIINSIFRDNDAIQAGGVLILYGESLSAIINNTFTNNSAIDYGGVIHCSSGSFDSVLIIAALTHTRLTTMVV